MSIIPNQCFCFQKSALSILSNRFILNVTSLNSVQTSVYNVNVCSILCKKKNNGDMSRPTSLNSLCLSAPSHTVRFTQNLFQIDPIIACSSWKHFDFDCKFCYKYFFSKAQTMENIGGGMAALSKSAVGLIWLGRWLE